MASPLSNLDRRPTSDIEAELVYAGQYRQEIIDLFARNERVLRPSEFDWYFRSRGQATPSSWILRTRKGQLCGLLCVTVRQLQLGHTMLRAGVTGNLMVDRSAGISLAAFTLLRAAKQLVLDGTLDVLLGIPNQLAQPVFTFGRFQTIDRWATHAIIFDTRDLLASIGSWGKLASPAIDFLAAGKRFISHWPSATSTGFTTIRLSERELHNAEFERWATPGNQISLHPSGEFLEWRFLKNPFSEHEIKGLVEPGGSLCAYFALKVSRGRSWVVDWAVNPEVTDDMSALLHFCQNAPKNSLWFATPSSSQWAKRLPRFGFVRATPQMGGYPDFPLVGFWNEHHPLAHIFADATRWNLFPGFNDI